VTSPDFFSDAASIGELFRLARVRGSHTQEAVAEAAGISAAHLSRLERDEKLPGPSVAYGLARTLGLSNSQVTPLIWKVLKERADEDEARYFREYTKAGEDWNKAVGRQVDAGESVSHD
jgi:transcriptional regulator with XRE-family HTH domain